MLPPCQMDSAFFPTSPLGLVAPRAARVLSPRRLPFLLRMAPPSLRGSLYYRRYRWQRDQWLELYQEAPLHFAPGYRMNLWPSDEGHSNIAFTGIYEIDLSRRIAELGKKGGLMVDVGANYGYFSLLWAAARVGNRVIAIEASPRNQESLRSNVVLNGLGQRIDVRGVAAGEKPGLLPFSLGTEAQTGWGGFTQATEKSSVNVEVVTLDSAVPEHATVNVLKVDVEGADTWVLYGARQLLEEKRIKNIFFEHNSERMAALGIQDEAARDFLESVGYRVSRIGKPMPGFVEYYATPAG